MYKRILAPLDGSELAEVALPYAEGLAAGLGSELTLIHICASEKAEDYHAHDVYIQKMAETIMERGEAVGIKVNSAHLVGHTAEQIVDYAEREKIGLIVMATHGYSGIRRWVLGDVAAKVVRATNRPVALIRAEGGRPDVRETDVLRKALVPLDGSKESEAIIPHIEELGSTLKAEVVLLHVMSPTYFVYSIPGETVQMPFTPEDMEQFKEKAEHYLETVITALKNRGINVKAEVSVGAAADEIIRFADEIQADIVAMSTHGRSGISRWAFGSTADKVLHAGNTPVLLVRTPDGSTQ